MTETPAWERELVVARARRSVAERALREAANAAALAGAGRAPRWRGCCGSARPDAEKLLAEIERDRGPDGQLPADAYAVAERYAAGDLSREQLIERLPPGPTRPGTGRYGTGTTSASRPRARSPRPSGVRSTTADRPPRPTARSGSAAPRAA